MFSADQQPRAVLLQAVTQGSGFLPSGGFAVPYALVRVFSWSGSSAFGQMASEERAGKLHGLF